MVTLDHFIEYLRSALDHLYDPDQLRRNPLIGLFDLGGQADPSAALQDILGKAIEALEPKETVPAQARAWRLYDLLVCRYLQQLSVHEVADQLGISRRHLRREQNAALETLTHRLWKQFNLETRVHGEVKGDLHEAVNGKPANLQHRVGLDQTGPDQTGSNQTGPDGLRFDPMIDEELDWLRNLPAGPSANLHETLADVLNLVSMLAARNHVTVHAMSGVDIPAPAVHPMALRQLLLNLMTVAIENAPGCHLSLTVAQEEWNIIIVVQGQQSSLDHRSSSPEPPEQIDKLSIVQKLANLIGARLTILSNQDIFRATATLPALEQLPILVIDDNADMVTLLQRYAKGTRYRIIGEQEPANAVRVTEQLSPQVILLDVMMPDIDGWEILGRLRQNPHTKHIPVVVCSILAMEGLALSLGANACVQKPLSQSAFLATLDAQIGSLETKSRQ